MTVSGATIYLIITFYTSYGVSSNIVPQPFIAPTFAEAMEACEESGNKAKRDYTGGALVDYVCVVMP